MMDGKAFDRDVAAAKWDTRLGVVLGRERGAREGDRSDFLTVSTKNKNP